jgi:hypothetical protein
VAPPDRPREGAADEVADPGAHERADADAEEGAGETAAEHAAEDPAHQGAPERADAGARPAVLDLSVVVRLRCLRAGLDLARGRALRDGSTLEARLLACLAAFVSVSVRAASARALEC